MKLLRFYYYTFLYHYRNRPESWMGEFRALLLVELSLCWLLLAVWLLFDPGMDGLGGITKMVLLLLNVAMLIILYLCLMHKGRDKAIAKEFANHPLNTEMNRIICWGIWVGTLIFFFIAAALQP